MCLSVGADHICLINLQRRNGHTIRVSGPLFPHLAHRARLVVHQQLCTFPRLHLVRGDRLHITTHRANFRRFGSRVGFSRETTGRRLHLPDSTSGTVTLRHVSSNFQRWSMNCLADRRCTLHVHSLNFGRMRSRSRASSVAQSPFARQPLDPGSRRS